jgi:hypothetical protein
MSKLTTVAQVKAAMLAKIEGSLLTEKDAVKLKFKPLTAVEVKKLNVPAAVAGFVLPYFTLDGKVSKFWRVRYLEDTRKGFDVLNGRKPLRYVQPDGGVNEVYLPPFQDWRHQAENATCPLIITEGELKAACATRLGLPTIGLGGVYSFKSKKNRESLLPMLREFVWKDREVTICYDSDAISNPLVILAENQLATVLTGMGAVVKIARIPPGEDGAKMGLDDYIIAHGADSLMELVKAASNFGLCFALHQMNEQVAYVRNPGFVYDFKASMRVGCVPFLQHSFANHWFWDYTGDKPLRKQTAVEWLKWEHRTELEAVTFAPGQPKIADRKLNQWEGWPIEPKKGNVQPWKDLLAHLFKNTEPEARKWFEQWCAYPLQNPGGKMASCALLWGTVQGSGKTLVGHTLMRIYGKYSSEITDAEIEDDRFDWAENMQFILADDITGSSNRKLANRLKTMITQKTLKINPKYIPRYSVPDCLNYYFTSNSPDAFYMDDGDRRNFIHEVRAGKIPTQQRIEYVAWRDSDAGAAALFHYLLDLDLSDFDPQAEPFVTHAKTEMMQITKSDLGSWVGDLRNFPERLKLPGDLFTAGELLLCYDPAATGKVTANGMARELKKAGYRAPGEKGFATQTKFGTMRLYAMKNVRQWETAPVKKIVEHYEGNRSMEPTSKGKGIKKY